MRLEKLNKKSLAELAANQIRKLILQNKLLPGTLVTERDLSEQLGISRTPMREAIRILASEKLLWITDTGRTSVADPDLETILNLLKVLGSLEGLAGELACSHITDNDVKELTKLNFMMKKLLDSTTTDFFENDMLFHKKIVQFTKNQPLIDTHKSINDQLYRIRFLSSHSEDKRRVATNYHDKILKSITDRDPIGSRRSLVAHLKTAESNIKELYRTVQAEI